MSKTVPFKTPQALPKPAEDWIGATPATPQRPGRIDGPTKRLTVDIPADLHRRIKIHCAGEGSQISDVVRELLAREYPPA